MASSLTLKRLVSSNVVPKSLSLLRPSAPAASRFLNTNAVRQFEDDRAERDLDVDRRSGRPLSDVLDDLFWPTRSLNQILNTMDQPWASPFFGSSPGSGYGLRRGWNARETDDALHFRIDMPGLDKEDVTVTVEQNTLVIKGEGAKESEDEESGRRFSSRIDLPEKIYRTDEIKAEMKNGVLRVVVPKVKEEERTDVINVKVE